MVSKSTNLSERLLKLNGRWKSDCVYKDMCVLEDVSKRLEITANLGL